MKGWVGHLPKICLEKSCVFFYSRKREDRRSGVKTDNAIKVVHRHELHCASPEINTTRSVLQPRQLHIAAAMFGRQ